MLLYLDACVIVKNYVQEAYSDVTRALLATTQHIGTSLMSQAEVAATFAKGGRMGYLTPTQVVAVWHAFDADWPTLLSLEPTVPVIAQAADLALTHGLRGYDAVHLATALTWQQQRAETVTLATFDCQLWNVGAAVGLTVWPQNQP